MHKWRLFWHLTRGRRLYFVQVGHGSEQIWGHAVLSATRCSAAAKTLPFQAPEYPGLRSEPVVSANMYNPPFQHSKQYTNTSNTATQIPTIHQVVLPTCGCMRKPLLWAPKPPYFGTMPQFRVQNPRKLPTGPPKSSRPPFFCGCPTPKMGGGSPLPTPPNQPTNQPI